MCNWIKDGLMVNFKRDSIINGYFLERERCIHGKKKKRKKFFKFSK